MCRLCDSGLILSCALGSVLTAIHICLCIIKNTSHHFMLHKQMWIAVNTLRRAQESIKPESHSRRIVLARCANFHSDRCNSTVVTSSTFILRWTTTSRARLWDQSHMSLTPNTKQGRPTNLERCMSSLHTGFWTDLNENWHTASARCAGCVIRVWFFLVL